MTCRRSHQPCGNGSRRVLALCIARPALSRSRPFANNGPSANRVDLVIMGDGFTAAQIASGAYAAQIEIQVQRLFAQERTSSTTPSSTCTGST